MSGLWYCEEHRAQVIERCGGDKRPGIWGLWMFMELLRDDRFRAEHCEGRSDITLERLGEAMATIGPVCCYLPAEALERTFEGAATNIPPGRAERTLSVQS